MGVFESMLNEGSHEQVVFCRNDAAGLKAIIAIHDTTLGPALGGCRMWHYETEEEALTDVLRLSRGMTYKAAAAGLNLGGGKAVIIGKRDQKSEELFRVFGRFIRAIRAPGRRRLGELFRLHGHLGGKIQRLHADYHHFEKCDPASEYRDIEEFRPFGQRDIA